MVTEKYVDEVAEAARKVAVELFPNANIDALPMWKPYIMMHLAIEEALRMVPRLK